MIADRGTVERERQRLSPLELLLPDGRARLPVVVGGACPPRLRPGSGASSATTSDLVVLAPLPVEAADAGWLRDAVARVAALPVDGVACVIAPPHARRRAQRLLKRVGFTATAAFLPVPSAGAARFVLPVEREPLRFAFAHFVPVRRRSRIRVALVDRLPTLEPVRSLAPAVLLAFRRPTSRPLFAWLFDDSGEDAGTAILAGGLEGGAVTVLRFPLRAELPTAVAKLFPGEISAAAVAARLRELGGDASAAGASVPRLLPSTLDSRNGVLTTVVQGKSARLIVARDPAARRALADTVTTWLDRWHQRTVRGAVFTRELLGARVLEPLAVLERALPSGVDYRRRLERLCDSLEGRAVPLVAAHEDLTMSNVLYDSAAGLGIVDWEKARPDGLPLTDYFYAAADAAAAVRNYDDRARAVRECFGGTTHPDRHTEQQHARLAGALNLDQRVSALCFHACWLQHAVNEAEGEGERRPFLEILRYVAEARDLAPAASLE